MYSRTAFALIFLLLATRLMAQQKPYDYATQWNKIDELVSKKGQPLSALKLVDSIYARAKKEGNDPQLLKALVYRSQLNTSRDIKTLPDEIRKMEKELVDAREPRASLLHSLIASSYWNYFQQNRYKFYNRTTVQGKKSEDIDTWTSEDLHATITSHFLASVKNRTTLVDQKLSDFDPVIVKGNARALRPSLYDLLAHEALEYFTNPERTIQKPVDAFVLNDPIAYGSTEAFSKQSFGSKDSSAIELQALRIYQALTTQHLHDQDPAALIDVELERLAYVSRISVADDQKLLYRNALKALADRYPTREDAAMARFNILEMDRANAMSYNPRMGQDKDRFALVKIHEGYLGLEKAFPNLPVGIQSYNARQQIEQPSLQVQTESVNLPDQPFRALARFQQVKTLYYRIINLDASESDDDDNDRWSDNYWNKMTSKASVREQRVDLPQAGDFRAHSVEVKVDALPLGHYALLASTGPGFVLGKDLLTLTRFHVTSIGWFNNKDHYFFVDRETGYPLPQASVQVWQMNYDYNSRKQKVVKLALLHTDLEGHVRLPAYDQSKGYLRLEVNWKTDHYFPDQNQFVSYSSSSSEEDKDDGENFEDDNRTIQFFTDRSIYRPGQIIHFKGLVFTKDSSTKRYKIQSGFRTKVRLMNANNQRVDSMTLVTNEYGTISGAFNLPKNQLTGEFALATDEMDQNISFRVEEYKRPKFHTEFEPLKGEYLVNDTITTTGIAKAYAGNTLNGAKVEYRVTRRARFNYPLWGRGGWRSSPEQEIAHGNTVTDGSGKYELRFNAIPDLTIPETDDPIFDYSVTADVTDLNGETRTASQDISAGYRSLQLNIKIPLKEQYYFTDSIYTALVQASNMANEPQKTPYTLTVRRLASPERLIRKRYWEAPDTFLISKDDYLKWFPYDEYARETAQDSWEVGPALLTLKDTSSPHPVALNAPGLKAGWYLVEAIAADRNGKPVRARSYVQINDRHDLGAATRNDYFLSLPAKSSLEAGESTKLSLVSNADDLWILQERMNGQEPNSKGTVMPAPKPVQPKKRKPSAITSVQTDAQHPFQLIKLAKGTMVIDISATEADKGGFGFGHAFVKHNRFFNSIAMIGVPWSEKELDVSFKSYRDKTEPGSKEQWTVSVKGHKGEKLAAEVLTSAYDASLDQFSPHAWSQPSLFPIFSTSYHWQNALGFNASQSEARGVNLTAKSFTSNHYETLIWQNAQQQILMGRIAGVQLRSNAALNDVVVTGYGSKSAAVEEDKEDGFIRKKELTGSVMIVSQKAINSGTDTVIRVVTNPQASTQNPIRTNFNETAFFYPDLHTDADGNVTFSFTTPDALTQWKTQVFAHTKDLAMGMATQTFITQKELMVQPNAPRFLREGDRISFAAKVANLADSEITGSAKLQLIDPETGEPVDGWFKNTFPVQYFTVAAEQSSAVKFDFEVPTNYNKPLRYRIVASSGNKSDGEEAELPVLSNRMLVTESMPILMKGDGTKNFSFDKLLKNASPSLTHHALTVEYSTNPAWYAVQSLPYLAEFPHECAEQLFNRFYANALAEKVIQGTPKVKAYYDKWSADTSKNTGLISSLEKNPELKSILLQETPWLLDAKNEDQQKKNIATLFDLARISRELASNLEKLHQAQSPNGGFTWFPGGPDDRFITQYIASSIGHLKSLQAVPAEYKSSIDAMQRKALIYLDQRIAEDYQELLRSKSDRSKYRLGTLQVQYLYARSASIEVPIPDISKTAYNYFLGQAKKFWLQHGRMEQGMIALTLSRSGDQKTAQAIITSLKQYATQSPTLGMYWANGEGGWYWHQAPIETEALLIEAFHEVAHDDGSVEAMKQWLLTQKQTSSWKTTKATADAVYALLLQGSQWTATTPDITIKLGEKGTEVMKSSPNDEAGTGYFKKVVDGKSVTSDLGHVQVTVQHSAAPQALSWGSVYWQYFENLDAITPAASPFSIKKALYVEKNTDKGPVLVPVEDGAELKTGDKLIVRIEIRADRDMEYVHLKDMRASDTEPVNVLSAYKWQGGLGYYESTRDASTNFFFSSMPKGTFVFEYPLFVSAEGNFSVGIAQAECMYAPEFSAHSQGLRIRVRE